MNKRTVTLLLLALLLLDTAYTFRQHLHLPLDGDLAGLVVPHEIYRKVLADPLGLGVLLRHEVYNAPNRFFAHATLAAYFRHVPLALQAWLPPIDSVYVAAALLKTLAQTLLIALVAAYIVAPAPLFSGRGLGAAALVAPLFHSSGYYMQMGVVDKAPTYAVFYAVPMVLLLLYFLPFYRAARAGQEFRPGLGATLLLLALAVVLALNGPLVAPLALLTSLALLAGPVVRSWRQHPGLAAAPRGVAALRAVPGQYVGLLGFLSLCCVYSLYLGLSNAENLTGEALPLLQRYGRLPLGLFYELTVKLGLPLLLLALGFNAVLLRRQATPAAAAWLGRMKWVAAGAGLYVLLLPLGGYRDYRPYLIRYDTFQPVVLALIYLFGGSTAYLLEIATLPRRQLYRVGVGGLLVLFILADKPTTGANACERRALAHLAAAPGPVVVLPADCPVLRWGLITNPHDSDEAAELLRRWRVTTEKKLYYQVPAQAW